jgi:hypothetical protein
MGYFNASDLQITLQTHTEEGSSRAGRKVFLIRAKRTPAEQAEGDICRVIVTQKLLSWAHLSPKYPECPLTWSWLRRGLLFFDGHFSAC